MLDKNKGAAVIASMVDWASAFERQDSTLAIKKFINMGVAPHLSQFLFVTYLTEEWKLDLIENIQAYTTYLEGVPKAHF